jgi:DNA adenine methylase
VHAELEAMPTGEKYYYQLRGENPRSKFHRAVRFIYLNRHCFNGIYRTNLNGQFNVPFGGPKPGIIPPIETFRKCAQMLDRAELHSCDFGTLLSDTREGDFVYLDPPYAVESRRVFRQYGPREFEKKDLKRLASHLRRMHSRGVRFVVSYADCAEAREFLGSWKTVRMRVRRHVSGFEAARRTAYELVATNVGIRRKKNGNH